MRPMPELKVTMAKTEELVPYVGNAKLHPAEQVDQIAASIEEFGNNDPIAVWHNDDGELEIIEGHGRLMALKKLGIEECPVIMLDHMTDEQRRAYMLVHNQLTMNSGFDDDLLATELEKIVEIDMGEFGFSEDEENMLEENPYTQKAEIPQYQVTGEDVAIDELIDKSKTSVLIEDIENSGVSNEEKAFLIEAAHRHTVYNYAKIAEYYAKASKEMQGLMEDSALVIIDINDAIAKGYAKLAKRLSEMHDE